MSKKNLILLIVSVLILASAWTAFARRQDIRDAIAKAKRGPIPEAVSREDAIGMRPETPAQVEDEPKPEIPQEPQAEQPEPQETEMNPERPASFNLKVPFVPQAPFRVWDEIHEDACEEASILMLEAYVKGEVSVSLEEAERRIQELVKYQNETYGDFRSFDAEATAKLMRDKLGVKGAVALPVTSADDIRAQIALGRPVVIPAAGKLLNNPNFKNGGPLYHMLLIKGYSKDTFITNDPGTRVGADYVYQVDVVMNAIRDWNGGDVMNGGKIMIIVKE